MHEKGSCKNLDELINDNEEFKKILGEKNIFLGNFLQFRTNPKLILKFLILFHMKKDLVKALMNSLMTIKSLKKSLGRRKFFWVIF